MLKRNTLTIVYLIAVLVLITLSATRILSGYTQLIVMFMGVNIILTASLNLINGYMGEFSCGHAGFMAVGAYVSSLLSVGLFSQPSLLGNPPLPPWSAIFFFPLFLLLGGAAAALAGLLVAIPSFRTRGDYLAIITLAANYIIKSAIENIQSIGGARGFMGMARVVNAMKECMAIPWMMLWVLLFTGFTLWVLNSLVRSTYGKGIMAIRDDEVAAEIMSVDTRHMKMVAFMISSGLAGVAGGLFAHILGYINPGAFTIMKSTEVMVMVYLGGMGSLSGSVLSAMVFTVLMELLRPLQVLKWVVIPLLLILLMLFRPEGIMGNREIGDLFPRFRGILGRRPAGG